jgi:hypothetical protein
MKPWPLLVLVAALAGCPGAPNATPVAVVDMGKVQVSRLDQDVIQVSGAPGTISGATVTTVTVTVGRLPSPSPGPAAFGLLHLGDHLPIDSSYAVVASDGSFAAVKLGKPERGVLSGDELGVTPQNGLAQAGYTAYRNLP